MSSTNNNFYSGIDCALFNREILLLPVRLESNYNFIKIVQQSTTVDGVHSITTVIQWDSQINRAKSVGETHNRKREQSTGFCSERNLLGHWNYVVRSQQARGKDEYCVVHSQVRVND